MKTTKKSILFISIASILSGIGQLIWKKAANNITGSNLLSIFNLFILLGIGVYIAATIFMTLSYKGGKLSVLHPFLSTSYVWVVLISPFIFYDEHFKLTKLIGVVIISLGVSLIGFGGGDKK
jgi:drug/metabolite transporter (DMT)-like permease